MDGSKQARFFVADHAAEGRAWAAVSVHNLGSVVQWDDGALLEEAATKISAPDLIFISDELSGGRGLEVCRRLSKNSATRLTPIIMMTSRNDELFVHAALEAGALDVLQKPLLPALLRARIKFYMAAAHRREDSGQEVRARTDELERMVDAMRGQLQERERAMSRAEFLFSHDLVTGLPNRRQLLELLERARVRAEQNQRPMAVVALSLDHFSSMQASEAREEFDRILLGTTRCIQASLRPLDFVARVSEDLFAAVLIPQDLDSVDLASLNAQEAVERTASALLTEVVIDGSVRPIQARTAVAIYPRDGERGLDLLKHIDLTLAASRGRKKVEHIGRSKPDLASALAMELRLRQAIDGDRLVPYYQPKVDFRTGKLLGGEALVRWPLRGGAYVGPAEFVPIAESSGLIPALDDYVLTATCCQIAEWQERHTDFRISVNLSAVKLHHRGIFDRLRELFSATRAKPEHLELEITESALITDFDAAKGWLSAVREMGVKIALDDFGTGYSSLAYLRRLPLDTIKIDQSFVAGLEVDRSTVAIVRAMISMAAALNMEIIAEGVENKIQAEILTRLGCHAMQGFMYSPAVPSQQFGAMLEKGRVEISQLALPAAQRTTILEDDKKIISPMSHNLGAPHRLQ